MDVKHHPNAKNINWEFRFSRRQAWRWEPSEIQHRVVSLK